MANRNSPQSAPLWEQVPKNPILGNEIPLGLQEHVPEQEMTPSAVAPDENNGNFLDLYHCFDVEAFKDWTTVTGLWRGAWDMSCKSQNPQMILNNSR